MAWLFSNITIQLPGMKIHLSSFFLRILLALFTIKAVECVNVNPLSETPTIHTQFKSTNNPNVSIRFVKNSGVCETTPGVRQISGYLDVGKNMSMWFWFFASRNSPETAPFTLWLNGGPGCSSMLGLFQENGPCLVNPDGKTTIVNPYSWNNISNIIYIDQPIGTGFSYGTNTVNSTASAAPFVWEAFQILFESGEFSKFKSREFILASESYGGHYGPKFVTFFNEQNAKIKAGKITGEKITVSALMINNGWFDPLIQSKSFVDFATNAPGYGPLQNDTVLEQLNQAFYSPGGCKEQMEACYAAGGSDASNEICSKANTFCLYNVNALAFGDRDAYDLRKNYPSNFPSESYFDFLRQPDIQKKIGAEVEYQECPDAPYDLFNKTGDLARTFLPLLGALANSRLKILVWAGDADISCNWLGNHASVLAMDWYGKKALSRIPFTNMTINGKAVAAIQNVDNFSFARVYAAGHQLPAFQPQAALEIFKQIVHREQLHSVYH